MASSTDGGASSPNKNNEQAGRNNKEIPKVSSAVPSGGVTQNDTLRMETKDDS